jgi:opacity protein-like surface antigen
MTQIKIKTQYKKHLITTLAISSIAGNAFAEGVKDGQFFVGGSINVQQDAYKLQKKNTSMIENLKSQYQTTTEKIPTATENLAKEESETAILVGDIAKQEAILSQNTKDFEEQVKIKNDLKRDHSSLISSIPTNATLQTLATGFSQKMGEAQNKMRNSGQSYLATSSATGDGGIVSMLGDNPINDAFNSLMNPVSSTNVSSVRQKINNYKEVYNKNVSETTNFNKWLVEDFRLDFARFGQHATFWGGKGKLRPIFPVGSDVLGHLQTGYNNVNPAMQQNPLFKKFYANMVKRMNSGINNKEMFLFWQSANQMVSGIPNQLEIVRELDKLVSQYEVQNSYIQASNTAAEINSNINAGRNDIKDLYNKLGIQNLEQAEASKVLATYKAQLEEQSNKLEEINLIQTSASKNLPSASLMFGYGFNQGDFSFITEAGVDLTSSKVGKNIDRQLEVQNIFHFYLTQKAGYRFTESSLTYITAGFGIKDYKAKYKGVSSKLEISESSILPTFIIGVGQEYAVNSNLALLLEFNHIMTISKLKTDVGDLSMRSEQVRIGARWYF